MAATERQQYDFRTKLSSDLVSKKITKTRIKKLLQKVLDYSFKNLCAKLNSHSSNIFFNISDTDFDTNFLFRKKKRSKFH